MVDDDSALEQAVSDLLAANPKTVEEYKRKDKGTWISGWSGDESDEGQGKSW